MKTVIALAAFVFFVFNAATMSSDGWDAGVRPLFEMFRAAFIGLALMSLIPVDWGRLAGFLKDRPATPESGAPPAAAAPIETKDDV
jgi:hypothetical protein